MRNTSIYLDDEDFQALADLSCETGNSVSALIREAIKEYLQKPKGGELP